MLLMWLQLSFRCWSALRYTGVRSGIRVTMSKTDEEKMTSTTEENAVSMALARVVRMGLRPPPRFPANGDWELWVSRFELYVIFQRAYEQKNHLTYNSMLLKYYST